MFEAYPHDLIKVIDWERHTDTSYIEKFTDDKEFIRVVKEHHKDKLWHEADILSSVLARVKLKKEFWKIGKEDPLFVRVYGDILEYDKGKRERLWEKITESLRKRDYEWINERLSEFPQDTRFPFVSLKTHHIITQILRNIMKEEKLKNIDRIYLMKIGYPISEFHRLKELRTFIDARRVNMTGIESILEQYYPIRIGDCILTLILSEDQVEDIIKRLLESKLPCVIEIFECILGKRRDPKTGKIYRYVKEFSYANHSICSEELEYRRKASTWAKILEEEGDVAWLSITLTKPMHKCVKEFVEWGFEALKDKGEELKGGWEVEEDLSPDLLMAFVEGYSKFLEDVKKYVGDLIGKNPDDFTPVSSVDYFLMIFPVDYETAINTYCSILDKRRKLHVKSVSISMVISDGKYPFWRIREVFDRNPNSFSWLVGESMYSLSDEDVRRVRTLIEPIKRSGVSKSVLYSIISKCGGMGFEELKLFIESLSNAGKLGGRGSHVARNLNDLVDYFHRKYGKDWKEKFRWSLKLLANFARRE